MRKIYPSDNFIVFPVNFDMSLFFVDFCFFIGRVTRYGRGYES